MNSAESNSSTENLIQEVKQELLTRFNTKYNELLSKKKHAPKVKSESDYDEIVSVVEQWAKGERFSTNQTKRNYGNR
jgi:dihydroneopterin aldolase